MKKIVLIDNDKMIQVSWKNKALKAHVEIYVFSSIDEFLSDSISEEKALTIYIDSDLGSTEKGEIAAESLFEAGFKDLFLTTGYEDLDVSDFPWLKGIINKRPPF